MKKISIYQLPVEHKAKFMDMEFVKEFSLMPELSDYKKVWETEMDDETSLDDIYSLTNYGKHPEGYAGHSMSVSDVVEMENEFFYCDRYGWEPVEFKYNGILTF